MIALVFLHLLQVLICGAYKSPRELQWVVGVLLLLVTLVLGLTGYLLPWDMDAYFASQVSLNITGLAPIAGPLMQHIAQGGGGMGTETINRFFGLHVWLMPAALRRAGRRTLDDLPPQRTGRSGGRRSAQAQAGTLLAGSDVHGRCVLVHRLRHHRLFGARCSAVLDAKGRPDQLAVRAVSGVVFSRRSSACSGWCRRN